MNFDHEHMDEIMVIAEKLQAEMDMTIQYIQTTSKSEEKLSVESLKTSYLLMKMADLERRMEIIVNRLSALTLPHKN